jgi:hypothetical protein
VFDSLDQACDVVRVEPDGASEMDGAQLAALDEALHRSGMDVEDIGGLICRQEPWLVGGRCGGGVASPRRAATRACSAFGRFVVLGRSLSFGGFRSLDRLVLRRLVGLEEGELTCVEPHLKWGNLSVTRASVNTKVQSVRR